LLTGAGLAQVGSSQPDASSIVQAMLKAQQDNKAHIRPFIVKRNYLLYDKEEQKAQVVANISVLPPNNKEYEIERSSGGMGEKVLRDVLKKETEPAKETQRKEISPDNYNFQWLGEESLNGQRCYVLSLLPKRDEKDLLKGKIWIDATTYNIRQIEGSPVKNPSWWVRDVNIQMKFAEVDGMWLHTATYAEANVRFKGKYVMQSHDMEYRFAQETASRRPRHRRPNPAIFAGSAINP
jgi:hypothetical protein